MVGLTGAVYRLGAAMKSCKGPSSGFLCSVNLFFFFLLHKTEWNVRAAAVCFLTNSYKPHLVSLKAMIVADGL